MTKKILRARIQGNLDCLCGIYSVVNASLYLSRPNLDNDHIQKLFRSLISELADEGQLEDALFQGIAVQRLGHLINVVKRHRT